jgi:hypothetical protein
MNLARRFALKGHLTMSRKELERKTLLEQVQQGHKSLRALVGPLRLCYRQCRRIYQRFLQQGDAGLGHRSRGRASNRRTDPERREALLKRYRDRYEGFGPTFAAEKLAEDGFAIDHETLRRWLIQESLWQRQRRRGRHRSRRERRAHFGELVQLDGSHHQWWPGQRSCLMNMVDDATSRRLGLLAPEETTQAAMQVLWQWIRQYGIPQALYVDLKNVFITDREPTLEEQLAGQKPLTAFGRACQKLGIELIPAYSPQAKGRVERHHGVDQDRLVKELGLREIRTLEAANGFLAKSYWKQINAKFSVLPSQPQDFHRPVPKALDLREIFCWEESRLVHNDWTLRYDSRCLQILPDNASLPRAKDKVLVRQLLDGTLQLWYRDQRLRFQEIQSSPPRLRKAKAGRAAHAHPKRIPAADHPWRRPLWAARKAQPPSGSPARRSG